MIASAAQSYLANGGTALEQLLNALRSRSERVPEDKERVLEQIMEEELLKEIAVEVEKSQECTLKYNLCEYIINKLLSQGLRRRSTKLSVTNPCLRGPGRVCQPLTSPLEN